MASDDHDIIIAGAGPAGSALAIELAAEGYRVLMLDAAKFPRDKPCGDYVSPRGLARLDELGCSPRLRALGCTPLQKSQLFLNRERLVAGTLPAIAGLPPHGHAIPRRELDHVLVQRAAEVGANIREECRVTGFEYTARGIDVLFKHGGKAQRTSGQLLVGADGATSAVAHSAGLRMTDPRYTLASIRAYAHGLTLDQTIMYFDKTYFPGYAWVFPVRRGLCNIGVGMVSDTLVRSGLRLPEFYATFQRFTARLAQAHGAAVDIGPKQGWPIRTYGGARRNYFARGLLIGEAGCFVDPINGEGIPLALTSAHIAARTIRTAFRSGRFAEEDLARYEADWRATFDPDLGISDLVVSMIRYRPLLPFWLAAFRAMSHAASRDPHYARITGGILGGVVPARRALTAEMFARTLAQQPDFLLRTAAAGGWSWLSRAPELWREIVEDGANFRTWLREVEAKQRRVAWSTVIGRTVQFDNSVQ